jgi:hypothetical protein
VCGFDQSPANGEDKLRYIPGDVKTNTKTPNHTKNKEMKENLQALSAAPSLSSVGARMTQAPQKGQVPSESENSPRKDFTAEFQEEPNLKTPTHNVQ